MLAGVSVFNSELVNKLSLLKAFNSGLLEFDSDLFSSVKSGNILLIQFSGKFSSFWVIISDIISGKTVGWQDIAGLFLSILSEPSCSPVLHSAFISLFSWQFTISSVIISPFLWCIVLSSNSELVCCSCSEEWFSLQYSSFWFIICVSMSDFFIILYSEPACSLVQTLIVSISLFSCLCRLFSASISLFILLLIFEFVSWSTSKDIFPLQYSSFWAVSLWGILSFTLSEPDCSAVLYLLYPVSMFLLIWQFTIFSSAISSVSTSCNKLKLSCKLVCCSSWGDFISL